MATKKKEDAAIVIPALNIQHVNIRIIGDSPLISHAWSEKAKLMMLQKQTKKATTGKEIRRPSVEFAESLYWLTEKPNLSDVSDDETQEILNEIRRFTAIKLSLTATAGLEDIPCRNRRMTKYFGAKSRYKITGTRFLPTIHLRYRVRIISVVTTLT